LGVLAQLHYIPDADGGQDHNDNYYHNQLNEGECFA
jgi:hypothetical protein